MLFLLPAGVGVFFLKSSVLVSGRVSSFLYGFPSCLGFSVQWRGNGEFSAFANHTRTVRSKKVFPFFVDKTLSGLGSPRAVFLEYVTILRVMV